MSSNCTQLRWEHASVTLSAHLRFRMICFARGRMCTATKFMQSLAYVMKVICSLVSICDIHTGKMEIQADAVGFFQNTVAYIIFRPAPMNQTMLDARTDAHTQHSDLHHAPACTIQHTLEQQFFHSPPGCSSRYAEPMLGTDMHPHIAVSHHSPTCISLKYA